MSRWPVSVHGERGAAAIFVALAMTVFVAAMGLSVDIGNVAYQRSIAQDLADDAALHIAKACAKDVNGPACINPTVAAASVVGQDSRFTTAAGGGSGASVEGKSAIVEVTKTVKTPLLSVVGISSEVVKAKATASVDGGHPTEGFPVLPLGVGYCTWKNHSASAGTATEASDKIALRTDTLQAVANLVSPLTGGLLPVDNLLSLLLGVGATESCTNPSKGQLLTLSGAVWLAGENVVTTLLSGLLSYNASSCELRVGSDLLAFVGAVEGAVTIPATCAQKFGPGKDVMVGKTILLPIYVPRSNLQNAGLNLLGACVGLQLLSTKYGKTCVEVPPKIGVDIVGYAPFKITGWTYPGTPNGYTDTTVGCSTQKSLLNLNAVINSILSLGEYLLNVVGQLLTLLLGPASKLQFSLACNGLQGYFTKSFTKDPNFQYATGADEFGAGYVKLTK